MPNTGESTMMYPEPMIVDSNTGEAYPIGSTSVAPSGPETESNGTVDRELMVDHSVIGNETHSKYPSVMGETACPRDPMILSLKDGDVLMNPSLD